MVEDHPLTGVRLCNTFEATVHTAGRSSIHLKTRHAVVTVPHLSWTTTTTTTTTTTITTTTTTTTTNTNITNNNNDNSDKNHSISIQTLAVLSCDYHGTLIHKVVNIHDFSTLKVEQNITVLFVAHVSFAEQLLSAISICRKEWHEYIKCDTIVTSFTLHRKTL